MPGALQRPAVVSRISDLIGYTPSSNWPPPKPAAACC